MCLLHFLLQIKAEYNLEIFVAHINHMIRENAKIDEEFVKEFCRKNNLECFVKRAEVQEIARQEKIGTEEAGRNVRYEFFNEILQKKGANKIATAHNCNDKIETIIMNLLRGSSISGLKGIEPIRNNKYIRPLIVCNRSEIEEYCKKNELNPRHDESNDEVIYTRNKVRNIVIPYIKSEFNPNIINTLNRLSEVATEENEYLECQSKRNFEDMLEKDANEIDNNKNILVLNLKKFNSLELVIKRRVILYTINKLIGTTKGIEKVNLEEIIALCNKNVGNKFLTPIKNLKILVKDKKIFFIAYNNLP